MRRALLLALAGVLLAAGLAAAHGSPRTMTQDVDGYHVEFHTVQSLVADEWYAFAWNVTDAESGDTVDRDDVTATFTITGDDGSTLQQEEQDLALDADGLYSIDVRLDTGGTMEAAIHLGGTEAAFTQPVAGDQVPQGDKDAGGDEREVPLPAALAFAAVALAGVALTRRD